MSRKPLTMIVARLIDLANNEGIGDACSSVLRSFGVVYS